MRYLAGSLDGVLADAILIPPYPSIPPTNKMKVRCLRKLRQIVTEKEKKKGDVGMAKHFSKRYGNKG